MCLVQTRKKGEDVADTNIFTRLEYLFTHEKPRRPLSSHPKEEFSGYFCHFSYLEAYVSHRKKPVIKHNADEGAIGIGGST